MSYKAQIVCVLFQFYSRIEGGIVDWMAGWLADGLFDSLANVLYSRPAYAIECLAAGCASASTTYL